MTIKTKVICIVSFLKICKVLVAKNKIKMKVYILVTLITAALFVQGSHAAGEFKEFYLRSLKKLTKIRNSFR